MDYNNEADVLRTTLHEVTVNKEYQERVFERELKRLNQILMKIKETTNLKTIYELCDEGLK